MSDEEVDIDAGSEEHTVATAELEVELAKQSEEIRVGWRSQSGSHVTGRAEGGQDRSTSASTHPSELPFRCGDIR